MSQEVPSTIALFTVGLQRRVDAAAEVPIPRQELRRVMRGNLAKEEERALKQIRSKPRQMREALEMIQQMWQEEHRAPLQRPYLAAQVVLESNVRPMLEDSFAWRELGKSIESAIEFDYSFGMIQVISPLSHQESPTGRAAESGLNKAMSTLSRLPLFRRPVHEQDQMSKAVAESTEASRELLMSDKTGFALVDNQVARLEALFGNGETPPMGNLALLNRALVLAGANASRRLYKAVYPLTEDVAPELQLV